LLALQYIPFSAPLDPDKTAEYMRASFDRTKTWAADLLVAA